MGKTGALPSLDSAFLAFTFLAYGTTPLVAAAIGPGNPEAGRLVWHALALAVGTGLVVLLMFEICAVPILRVMDTSGVMLGTQLADAGAGSELASPTFGSGQALWFELALCSTEILRLRYATPTCRFRMTGLGGAPRPTA